MSMTSGVGIPARHVLDDASHRLGGAGCETPRVDAEILLAHVLGTTRSGLRAEPDRSLSDDVLATLEDLVARRERREPLAYVLGEWGFRRLTLKVDRRVLVPRPETEIVVGRCLPFIAGLEEPRVLDVGTGSGAIALAIADEYPGARVTGIDASADALAVARGNALNTSLAVELLEWDLFTGLPAGPWDLIVSNPPYVRPNEIELLEPEVRDWEPRAALVGDVRPKLWHAVPARSWVPVEHSFSRSPTATPIVLRGSFESWGTRVWWLRETCPVVTGWSRA